MRTLIGKYILPLLCAIGMITAAHDAHALDAPHDATKTVTCATCHIATASTPTYLQGPYTGDESYNNNLCMNCHNFFNPQGMNPDYSDILNHSSIQTGTAKYGTWKVDCVTCHNPHNQRQASVYAKDPLSSIVTGTQSGVGTGTVLTVSTVLSAGTLTNYILMPNTLYPAYMYRITGNTTNSITVEAPGAGIPLGLRGAGKSFAVKYGKLLKETLAAPAVGNVSVKFFTDDPAQPNSYGSSTNPADVTGICQVCHTRTTSFNRTNVTGSIQEGPNHPPVISTGQKCKECHVHSKGFKGECNACHGYPPNSTQTLVFKNKTGVTVTSDSGSGPGAHVKHVDSLKLVCANCHANGMLGGANKGDDKINIGFNYLSGVTTGSYDGKAGRSFYPYNTPPVTVGNTYQCSNIYCHSSGQGSTSMNSTPVYTQPKWNDPATGACGTCHGVITPLISTGSHTKHLAADTNCGNCHTGAAASSYPATNHVNKLIDVANSYTAGGAPGNGYGSCTANCHNAYGSSGIATPQWGTNATCNSCHPIAADGAPATGSHALHIDTVGSLCGACHDGAVKDSTGGTAHTDGDIDVTKGYPANVAKHAPGSYTGSCSTSSCHGPSSPVWGANTANDTCTKCHGTGTVTVSAGNRYVVAPPKSVAGVLSDATDSGQVSSDSKIGAHQTHLRYLNGLRDTTMDTVDDRCGYCHGALPVSSTHSNGSSTPVFSGLATTAGMTSAAFNSGTCSNVYCHNPASGTLRPVNAGTGTAPSWTNAAYIADGTLKTQTNCNICHKVPGDTGFEPAGTHGGMTIAGTDCTGCHEHNGNPGGSVGRRHMDGSMYGAGSCNSCHDYDVDPVTGDWGWSQKAIEGWGAHAKHISHLKTLFGLTLSAATDTFGGAVYNQVCGVCHTKSPSLHSMSSTTNIRSITFSDGSPTYLFSTGSPTYTGVTGISSQTTVKTCSNVSCHFQASPVWEGL